MKKGLLSLFIVCSFLGGAWAQSLKVMGVITETDISGNKTSRAFIKNISSTTQSVRVIRTTNQLATEHQSYFCWNICFGPSTSTSGLVSIDPGATDSSHFHGYLTVGSNTNGASTVAYEFVNDHNSTDSVMIVFNYNAGATGIKDVSASEIPSLQSPYPSPANTYSTIKYNISNGKQGTLNIYNALGALAYKTAVDEKQNEYIIPTLLLADGMYFCTLQVDGKPIATKKLIVDHRN